ncbi:hypothetical protein AB4Z34_08535 [Ensifer sp. 2YAB10]|uniref:hypothetical protein n=1 Tax=Ensifer TaxID=106591 RepID=UPI000DE1B4E3|nr:MULTISPECIES: hypothetical protein [Ensifer]MBK5566421.1 hypothetical protein [Ensifer sp. SSB1]MBZ7922702.1 hypothetical protein [Ensifer adhaerens]UAX91312.1 hypothetical protein LAC78_12965 [Ensifer adhaerens]UAX98940.1 hypothetical protein LAC80_12970 [Ensifer adhaerens]UAY06323.1 hypothetical protein LAC81_12970 [Ensifer adhaerens]
MERTHVRELADEYVRLGGHRRVVIDDNETSVRSWEEEPPEAESFWQKEVETLPLATQREVQLMLRTINRL